MKKSSSFSYEPVENVATPLLGTETGNQELVAWFHCTMWDGDAQPQDSLKVYEFKSILSSVEIKSVCRRITLRLFSQFLRGKAL